MYKLTFRLWLALVAVIVVGAAAYFAMKQFPTALIGLPGAVIILAVLAAPLLVSFLAFAKGSVSQKVIIATIGVAFGLVYGLAANVNFGTTKLLPNFQLLINEYLLGVMALGGAVTALALCSLKPAGEVASAVKKSGPTEVVIPDKEETTPKTSSTKLAAQSAEPLTKNPASISNTNLKGILDNLAPDDEVGNEPPAPAKTGLAGSLSGKSAAPAPAKQAEPAPTVQAPAAQTPAATSPSAEATAPASGGSPTDSQNNLPGQKKATTGTVASSTATRLQAQKRKSTSTFTKLQALSASGTGGIRPKPLETSSGDNDADSLKSILDRLDTKQEDAYSAPDEVEMDSLFGQESLLSPPEVADEPLLPEPPKPKPEPVAPKPEPVKAAEPPKPAVTPAPKPAETPKPASAAPAKPAAKQYDSPLAKKPEAAPSLSSMLDSLDTPKSGSTSSSAAKTSSPNISTSTTGGAVKPSSAPTPTSIPKPPPTGAKPATIAAKTPSPTPSASAPVKTPTPTSTPKPADFAKTVETPKPAAKIEAPAPKPEVKPAPKPAEPAKAVAKEPIKAEPMKEEPGLFETGLDKEIDDIFLNLVPAEAQKTVESKSVDEPVETKAEAPQETAKEADSAVAERQGGVFESTKIDQELDDIFSNLVPAEAQKEVSTKPAAAKPSEAKTVESPKPVVEEKKPAAEEKKPEPKPEPKPIKSEGMFEESGLDRELDDIFSNLAPSEAQRSVTHETLAKVRAADATGDHPAITPDNVMKNKAQEEMSFAPPSEETSALKEESVTEQEAPESEVVAESETESETLEESDKSGKFNDTLHAMPSLQATVEGLLNNLAASETVKTESFAPPESKNRGNGSGVADKVLDLIESLESSNESKAAQESAEAAAESSTGDIVSELFDTSSKEAEKAKEEPNDELVTETAVEEAPAEVAEEAAKEAEKAPAEVAEEPVKEAEEAPAEVAEEPVKEPEEAPAEVTAEVAEEVAEVTTTEAEADVAEAAKSEEAIVEEETKAVEAEEAAETKPASVEAETPAAEKEEKSAETAETTKADAEAQEAAAEPESGQSEQNRKTAKELKEFGRLSSKPGGSTDFQSETAGTMKTIGKLLIEVQAVENIIKAGESGTIGSGLTTARVISAARGEGIKALLSKIDSYSGVDGSIIVGHDGLVIASTAGPGMDKDTLGVLSVACLSTSNLATKKLEIGKLRQMVLVTDVKTTVLTDVDVGILAVFLDNNDVGKIDGLLEAIHDTIHG